MWSLLDEQQRARALQRARSLVRWNEPGTEISAKQAAADAGVSLVRFYQMNKLWREGPSLEAVGVNAAPARKRQSQFAPAVNQILQSVVAEIVADEDASVRSLALKLEEAARQRGISADQMPGHNTLRAIVERARRDRQRKRMVGNSLLLDHAACGLQRQDGAPWTLFLIVDEASHLILGAAPAEVSDPLGAYKSAAEDALHRLAAPSWSDLNWADRLAGVQLVPITNSEEAFEPLKDYAASLGVGLNLTADRKSGRYVERVIGRTIGVLPIWPYRVGSRSLPAWAAERTPELDHARATARVRLAVDDYNSKLIIELKAASQRCPPDELKLIIEKLASS